MVRTLGASVRRIESVAGPAGAGALGIKLAKIHYPGSDANFQSMGQRYAQDLRKRPPRAPGRCFAMVAALLGGLPAHGQDELLLFPATTVFYRSAPTPHTANDKTNADVELDLFYTVDRGRWRALIEAFASDHERHIERLQIGRLTDSGNTLWFGRFHNPLSYWNERYHHGAYVQTSISRPGIHEFEDLGGPLPVHLTGLMLDRPAPAAGGWRTTFALAAGPALTDQVLTPPDISLDVGEHKATAAARLSYSAMPGESELGLVAGAARLPAIEQPFAQAVQRVLGVFADWHSHPTRVVGEALFIRHRFDDGVRQRFAAGYLQAQYALTTQVTFYTRIERTTGTAHDRFLAALPAFVGEREVGGVRFEVGRQQALKLEWSKLERHGQRSTQWALQWSGSFP